MGTRGNFGFRKKGDRRGFYSDLDSDKLAIEIATFLAQISPAELMRLAKLVDELTWLDSTTRLESASTMDAYEHYGYNFDTVSGTTCTGCGWRHMPYAIQGATSLFEILDGKLRHMLDHMDQPYPSGLPQWSCFIDFELREVEIWFGRDEFALVSFDGLVEALHKYEDSNRRYVFFTVFLKEEFAIGSFGSNYVLEEDDDMKSCFVHPKYIPVKLTTSGHESEQRAIKWEKIASAPGTLMALPTELHREIIRHLHVDSMETLLSLHDDGKVSTQAQWALKRTCKHFWNLSHPIDPSQFFDLQHNHSLPTVKKREYQRLITAAWAPPSFPASCFPCYHCRKFLPVDRLHPYWGGKFYLWNEQYLSCCTPCLTQLANDPEGGAIDKLVCTEDLYSKYDRGPFWRLQSQLMRVQCLISVEVQQKLIKKGILLEDPYRA